MPPRSTFLIRETLTPAAEALQRTTGELAQVRGWMLTGDSESALAALDAAAVHLAETRTALAAMASAVRPRETVG